MRMTIRLYLLAASICLLPSFVLAQPTPPQPPPFMFNLSQVKFGAQSVGVQSCIYVTITNTSAAAQTIKKLYVADKVNYTMPSPSPQMLPISIQPKGILTISVCFKPTGLGDNNTYLALLTASDSLSLPIQGKGLKTEEIAKLPKIDVIVVKPSKKQKDWVFKLQLVGQSKVQLQLFDELGVLVTSFANNDLKPEGTIEMTFDETDKGKKKLPNGIYYLRAVIDEIGRNKPVTITKTVKIEH